MHIFTRTVGERPQKYRRLEEKVPKISKCSYKIRWGFQYFDLAIVWILRFKKTPCQNEDERLNIVSSVFSGLHVLLHKPCHEKVHSCKFRTAREYRDSLLETAREALTIWYQRTKLCAIDATESGEKD